MTEWLNRRLEEREEKRRHTEVVLNGTPAIWESIRGSVLAAVREYATATPQNQEPFDFIRTSPSDGFEEIYAEILDAKTLPQNVKMTASPHVKRKVQIRVNRSEGTITATYFAIMAFCRIRWSSKSAPMNKSIPA